MANYDLCPTCRGGVSAEKVSEATCTSPAIYKDVCGELCGWESDPYKSGDPKPHSYGGWTITNAPDCTNKGSHYKTCKNCSDVVIEEMNALGHYWNSGTVISEANCVHGNITKYTCQRAGCTEIYEEDDGSDAGSANHDWDDGTVDTPPTCTEKGITKYTCKREGCSGWTTVKDIDALGHTLTTETKAATCTEGGYTKESCSKCTYTYITTTNALDHDFGDPVNQNDATCQRGNTLIATCSRCSATDITYDDNTTDHNFTLPGDVEAYPTCTSPGSQIYWCTKDINCTTTQSKTIPALEHDMQKTGEYVAATCQHGGYDKTQCTRCPETGTTNESDPIDHNYATWIETVSSATCKALEVNKYKCTMCDKTETRSEGSYGDHVVKDNAWQYEGPTCTTDGYYYGTCSECGTTVQGSVDEGSAAHPQASLEDIPAVAATCSKKGSTAGQKCNACGVILIQPVETEEDPLNHKAIPVLGKDATCTESGLTEGTKCEWCGTPIEAQEIIDALGHDETEEITKEPGPGVEGEKTYTCSRCGAVRTEILPATPLTQYTVTINHVRKDNEKLITSIDTYFFDGTTCEILDYKYEPAGYEFDKESAPNDFPVTQDTIITLYYYKLATIITNHYAKNQAQTLLESNINEGNGFRVGTEIDLSQFANVYPNYNYSNNSGASSDNELYAIQDGINEINYFYNPSSEVTYTITCNYYKGLVADESLLYTSIEYSGLTPDSTFDPFDKKIVISGYEYYNCSETDPFSVTVNKNVNYFYKEVKSYTLTVYHEDIDNEGMFIATKVTHNGIREGTAINPADYQLIDEYLPEGWVYVEGTSIEKLESDNSITCYYKKSKSVNIFLTSIYENKTIASNTIQKSQNTNISDTKTLFDKYIENGSLKYTLEYTDPSSISNLQDPTEIKGYYRGYYGCRVKYVDAKTSATLPIDVETTYQPSYRWNNYNAINIDKYIFTGIVRLNGDSQWDLSTNDFIPLKAEMNTIEYLYAQQSQLAIQYIDYYNLNGPALKIEYSDLKNPVLIPSTMKNKILDNGYQIRGVMLNDTDVEFGKSYEVDLTEINVLKYICYPAFRNFQNETIKTGEKINIIYDNDPARGEFKIDLSNNTTLAQMESNNNTISLLGYNAGSVDITLMLGNYAETHTYTVQYSDTPQSLTLITGTPVELGYQNNLHRLEYNGNDIASSDHDGDDLCVQVSVNNDGYYELTGIKKQIEPQTIVVKNKSPEYIISKLYVACTSVAYTITYLSKNIATKETIKQSSSNLAKGTSVKIELNNPLYFINEYKLVAIEKNNEGQSKYDIEFTLEADTTITLWYETTTHTHNYNKYVETVAPSCTTQGYELWSCSCGETQQQNIIKALGHNWPNNWIVTVEPTETAPGQETRTCKRCGIKENQILPALGILTEEIDQITLQSENEDYYPTTTYDMIVVSKTNTDKLINIGAAAPSTLSKGSIYIEGGISVKSNLNSGWLRRIKNGTDRRISPKTTVDLIVLNQDNAQAFIVKTSAPVGETQDPAGTLYFVIGE